MDQYLIFDLDDILGNDYENKSYVVEKILSIKKKR